MNSNDKTSLQKLYDERKSRTSMPSSLKQSLLAEAKRKPSYQKWQVAVPTVFASLMVVVLIWPSRELLIDETTASRATYVSEMDDSAFSQDDSLEDISEFYEEEKVEMTVDDQNGITISLETTSVSEMEASPQLAQTPKPSALAKKASAEKAAPASQPLLNAETRESAESAITADMMNVSEPHEEPNNFTEIIQPLEKEMASSFAQEEVIQESLDDEDVTYDTAREPEIAPYLVVVNGLLGEYETCDGLKVELTESLNIKGAKWVQTVIEKDVLIALKKIANNPCL
jgi:hypothetical protein